MKNPITEKEKLQSIKFHIYYQGIDALRKRYKRLFKDNFYIRNLLFKQNPDLKDSILPKELLELKRNQLTLKHNIEELKK